MAGFQSLVKSHKRQPEIVDDYFTYVVPYNGYSVHMQVLSVKMHSVSRANVLTGSHSVSIAIDIRSARPCTYTPPSSIRKLYKRITKCQRLRRHTGSNSLVALTCLHFLVSSSSLDLRFQEPSVPFRHQNER